MNQVSTQQNWVSHSFTQQIQREIRVIQDIAQEERRVPLPAPSERPSLETPKANPASDPDLSFTPEQQIKITLIESLSGNKQGIFENLADFIEQRRLAAEQKPSIDAPDLPVGNPTSSITTLSIVEQIEESEQLDFGATLAFEGEEPGTEKIVSLSLSLQRELSITREFQISITNLQDPLIVNLGQRAQLLGGGSQQFDVNADGQPDTIPELAKDVWYLAYDRNQNGVIDNGLELFGARSGQGFNELAELDSSGNGWIDASDPLYQQLSLWDGSRRFQSLQQAGIKGLSLQASDTPFTFTDSQGRTRAQLKQTSVYLDNKDRLGAVHQIDFAI